MSIETQRNSLTGYIEHQLYRQMEEREIIFAQARERASTIRKPLQFKAADVTKPEVLVFDAPYSVYCDHKVKMENYYRAASTPEVHSAPDQQGIFIAFVDATIA